MYKNILQKWYLEIDLVHLNNLKATIKISPPFKCSKKD